MNGLTRVFLVLLRLAIGWHFLFEGLEKVESVSKGPTETGRPFSSEPYLREASGPLGEVIRKQIGDLDEAALESLTVKSLRDDQDSARIPPHQRISPVLEKDMDAYTQRFVDHYQLDEVQKKLTEAKLLQSKDQAVRWILEGSKDVAMPLGYASLTVKQTTAQRIAEYKAKLQQLHEIQEKKLPAFDRDVEKQNLRALKAEVSRLRSELLADLTQPLKDSLQSVLTDAQKNTRTITEAIDQPMADWSRIQWIDWLTRWGLVVVGAGLLLGLFTRTACLGGAVFLLLLYLSVPPFPWLPEPTRVEGHYYYVNKNLIEMLALLVLATTRSGCWLGLDGLLHWLNPWRRRHPPVVLARPGTTPR